MPSDPRHVPTEPENPISLEILNTGLKRVLEMEFNLADEKEDVAEKNKLEERKDCHDAN